MNSRPASPTFKYPLPLLATVNILLQFGDGHNFDDAFQAVATHPHIISLRLIVDKRADFVLVFRRHILEARSARIPTSLNHTRSVEILYASSPEHVILDFCQLGAR